MIPVIAIGKDVFTTIGFALVYATTGQFFVQPRIWGKACTMVQLILVAFCLLAPDLPFAATGIWQGLYWMASALAILAVADYLRIGNRFAAAHHADVHR